VQASGDQRRFGRRSVERQRSSASRRRPLVFARSQPSASRAAPGSGQSASMSGSGAVTGCRALRMVEPDSVALRPTATCFAADVSRAVSH